MPWNYQRKTSQPYTPRGTPIQQRFWSKVQVVPGADACWLWQGAMNDHGYGMFDINDKSMAASRAAWVLAHGEPTSGLCVLHRCDNRQCVRLDHLFLGTHQENMADARKKGRMGNATAYAAPSAIDGPRRGGRKLTPAHRDEIRQRLARGESQRALGLAFNVSHTAIWFVARSAPTSGKPAG